MSEESLGSRLKEIRLERGLTLEEVNKKTKIHINILRAIEGDSLTNLSPIYLKGFLKIYCKFLGVDPSEHVAGYKDTQRVVHVVSSESKFEEYGGLKVLSFLKLVVGRLSSLFLSRKAKQALTLIVLAGVLLLGLSKLTKFVSSKRSSAVRDRKVKVSDKVSTTQAKASVAADIKGGVKGSLDRKLNQQGVVSGINLVIRARENCWVYLKADGKVLFQRVLEKGRFESWQAKDKIELSLGNAGGVELEVNGQVFSSLGRRGQVRKNIVITKEGLNIGR